jgi:hypothetical protein
VENVVEPSPEVHPSEGLYLVRTLVQDRWKVPVTFPNPTHRDQKLRKGSLLAHCESDMLVTPPSVEQSQVRDTTPKLQDMIAAAKPNLSNA